jgi:glycopeptide antibiotics resistance protein
VAVAALAWSAFVVYGSLVPLDYRPIPLADAIERFRNLPPLGYVMGNRADWGANVLIFVPLTFVWMGALVADRRWSARIVAGVLLVPLSTLASAAIEFTQIWFPTRTLSLNDIVAETLGGAIGIVLWLIAGQTAIDTLRQSKAERQPQARLVWLLGAYLVGLIVYSVSPLDLTISVAEIYDKYRDGRVQLIPFVYPYNSPVSAIYQFFADVMSFAPVGALCLLTRWSPTFVRDPVGRAAVAGAVIAAAIECVQLLVLSRYTDVTDPIMGALGGAAGGWLVVRMDGQGESGHVSARGQSRQSTWPLYAAVAAYSAFLMVGFWYPFDVTRDVEVIRPRMDGLFRVPFSALYMGSELNALSQMLARVLLFVPLGGAWAWIGRRTRTRAVGRLLMLFGLAYAAALAFGIEAVQIVMPPKIADSTEVVLCLAGAAAGLLIVASLTRGRGAVDVGLPGRNRRRQPEAPTRHPPRG